MMDGSASAGPALAYEAARPATNSERARLEAQLQLVANRGFEYRPDGSVAFCPMVREWDDAHVAGLRQRLLELTAKAA
jgi:hypothetical protein